MDAKALLVAGILTFLCFSGIFLYWYFIPYQLWLALTAAGNNAGLIVAFVIALVVTGFVGLFLSIFLFALGIAFIIAAWEVSS